MDRIDSIKREAYAMALKFKNVGMDEEAIYARLEKKGIPVDIAREVAKNVIIKKIEEKEKLPQNVSSRSVLVRLIQELFK